MKTVYSISLRKMFPFALFVVLSSFFLQTPICAQGQISQYTFKTGVGVPQPSGDNIIWTGAAQSRRGALASAPIDFGFSFKFDGADYTNMIVYASGAISLGNSQINDNLNPDLASTNVPMIAGFWGGPSPFTGQPSVDLSGGASNNNWGGPVPNCGITPDVEYAISGNAPNRVVTIEWNNIDITSIEALSTWQIRLYETTNTVEFYYQHMTSVKECGNNWGPGTDLPTSAAIGLSNGNNNFMSVTPLGGSNASVSSSAASNTINIESNPIGDGTVYAFTIPLNIQLSVQPKNLSFVLTAAGTSSSPLCLTVSNAGTEPSTPLIVTGASITGAPDFTITSTPPGNSYFPDESGQYCITFRPITAGLRSAVLTITSTGRDSGIQIVNLSGVGGVAEITVDSTVRFKKTRTRLGDSLTQYVHITSSGQEPLFMSSFIFSGGDAGQYYISHFPQNPLPVGQVDSIGITYVPTLEGKHVATLTVNSNAFTFPSVAISLQGTGILPHIVLTPQLILFDSTREGDTVCKNIDIWNPGSDTLKILTNFLSSNDGDFHYTGLTKENSSIPPDNHRTVTVCFTPIQRGARQARLTLTTNIIQTFETPRRDTAGLLRVDIRGTGVPFGVFSNAVSGGPFSDSALIGTSVCHIDTLKNTGDADILVKSITINGSDFSYSNLPALPFLLKARSGIAFTICGTPDKQGLISGTATVTGTSSGSNISTVIPLNVFGRKICASAVPDVLFSDKTTSPATTVKVLKGSDSTLCEMVINCGDIAASYTATITGADQAQYTITSTNPSPVVKPGDTAMFCIQFNASKLGAAVASLNLSAPDITTISVPLTGEGVCASIGTITANVPTTGENEKKTFTITLTNNGTSPWSPGTAVINGTGSAAYTITVPLTPDPIPPGSQGTITIQFQPPVGSAGTTLVAQISWPNGGPCQDAVPTVTLNGASVTSSVTPSTTLEGFTLDQSYPNPTAGKASFSYTTPRETEISITLADMTGKLVRTLVTGRVSAGIHTVDFDAANLPSGTYIYILESGSTRMARQFILTR